MLDHTKGNIISVTVEDEMKRSYIDYAMSVIVGRALPDVRDGLKPVHRRILYAMHELGVTSDKPFLKSARIVGEVMGKYHPHGDAAIYDSMVRLAQKFSTRYLLVDGQGNFGSVDGDPPAAMRYTEARMSSLSQELLRDIEKETVNFVANFDGSLDEPSVLPSRFPNLIVNGSSGIAVGMATNIPPHNLSEVIDGIIYLINNPEATVKDLMRFIKGPDFPTAGLILGRNGIEEAYKTGRGSIKMRARARIENMQNGKNRILVTELPYQVNKAQLIEKIADLVKNKIIEGIVDLRDESDRTGMRIVIELKKDAMPNTILNQLYKHTKLEDTFGVIMLAIVDDRPKVLTLKEMLAEYIRHQKEIVIRRTKFDLAQAEERAHILEGLRIALANIDEIIRIVRGSRTPQIAKDELMRVFNFSDRQAREILSMTIQRLTGLEQEKIENEYEEVLKTIAELKEILADENRIYGIIKTELLEIKKKFGDERRTEITHEVEDIELEDLIAEEDIVVTLTHNGYIKRLPIDTYRNQRRGGKGITGITTKQEDFVEHLFITTTLSYILFFSNKGKMYSLRGYEIPEASRQARGLPIINLVSVQPGEKITTVIPLKNFETQDYLFMVTRRGLVKKCMLSKLQSTRRLGLIVISLQEDDDLIDVRLTNGEQEVILVTANGQSIRFHEDQVRPMGRTARGVKGISLKNGDTVVGMITTNDGKDLLVVTKKGFGKKTLLEEYAPQARGGKGIKTLKVTEKNGPIVGALAVSQTDDLMIITENGAVIRLDVTELTQRGRNTQGVILIKLDEDDLVGAVTRITNKS
jgi:DNA gyrase subunit A